MQCTISGSSFKVLFGDPVGTELQRCDETQLLCRLLGDHQINLRPRKTSSRPCRLKPNRLFHSSALQPGFEDTFARANRTTKQSEEAGGQSYGVGMTRKWAFSNSKLVELGTKQTPNPTGFTDESTRRPFKFRTRGIRCLTNTQSHGFHRCKRVRHRLGVCGVHVLRICRWRCGGWGRRGTTRWRGFCSWPYR
jgi:hypothetical protein